MPSVPRPTPAVLVDLLALFDRAAGEWEAAAVFPGPGTPLGVRLDAYETWLLRAYVARLREIAGDRDPLGTFRPEPPKPEGGA